MHGLFSRILAAGFVLPVGFAIVGTSPCFAQFNNGSPSGMGAASQRLVRGAQQNSGKGQVAPPPVLPGTKSSPEAAAPTQSPADMSPTEALFDAINRGDAAAARDAANRGADLQGQNQLGLTPLDLSVDLGRNDISFMLLSMRGGDASSRNIARSGVGPGGADDAVLRAGTKAFGRSRATAVLARGAEEPVAEAPRVYSGGGGAPIPAAGFVGFDSGRAVR
jgi:hypothetical protein